MKQMGLFRSALDRINEIRKRKITVEQSLPPYLLIALLWALNARSDDLARAAEAHANEIQIAVNQYNQDVINFREAEADRETCIGRVEARANNIDNWHGNFEGLRLLGLEFGNQLIVDYANEQQRIFDSKEQNQPLSVEADCAMFPEPQQIAIPPILIEEGILDPNT